MGNKLSILFLFLVFCSHCWAQAETEQRKPDTGVPGKQQNTGITAAGDGSAKNLVEVLFATNEDCHLFIDEELKGTVLKEEFLYVKLAPGTYRYTAKNPTTGDAWRDTFSVIAGRPNEVFIDFLYAIELENEKKLGTVNNTATPVSAPALKGSKLPVQQSTAKKPVEKEKELATITALIGNMVPIRGGNFVMGNNKSPSADEAEHSVSLKPYYFGKYEVSQQQWETIMGYNPSLNKNCPACPVENVSWEEVMRFIRKLNSITAKKFRLPTEAEWEYVAKSGGKAEIDKAGGVEEYIKKTAWGFINSKNKTHPVGKKQPNSSGVYDLTGNVSEWCMDWYGAYFYREEFTEKNPEGPPLGKAKIIRGGNYKDYVGDRFRPSFRNKMNPKSKTSEVGFRLVMEWQD